MGQLIPVINLRSNGFASLPPANHQLTVSFSSTPIQRTFLHQGVPRSRIGHFLLSPVTRRAGCVEHLPPNFTRVTHLSSLYHLLKPPLLPFLLAPNQALAYFSADSGLHVSPVYWGGGPPNIRLGPTYNKPAAPPERSSHLAIPIRASRSTMLLIVASDGFAPH